MHSKSVFLFVLMAFVLCSASSPEENFIEARGKKKKIALFVFFADLIIKKLFILKLVYAVILWVIIHKAGYFFSWFINYLKETKIHHHEHDHHEYDHHPHYEYGAPHHHEYGPHGSPQYSSYGPYRKESWAG